MARVDGHNPRGRTGSVSKSDRSGSTARRAMEPISGRRGRFGYYSGLRPTSHRWIGIAVILTGLTIALLNDAMLFTDVTLLPFGHREFWLLTGIIVAASGTWFLGLFDPSLRRP